MFTAPPDLARHFAEPILYDEEGWEDRERGATWDSGKRLDVRCPKIEVGDSRESRAHIRQSAIAGRQSSVAGLQSMVESWLMGFAEVVRSTELVNGGASNSRTPSNSTGSTNSASSDRLTADGRRLRSYMNPCFLIGYWGLGTSSSTLNIEP